MCEILVLKGNKKKLIYSKEAILAAMTANDDGVGYCILERGKANTYKLLAKEVFHPKPYTYQAPSTNPAPKEAAASKKSTKSTTKEVHTRLWVDYDIDLQRNEVSLYALDGTTITLKYPADFQNEGFEYLSAQDQQSIIESWLKAKKFDTDFNFYDTPEDTEAKNYFLEAAKPKAEKTSEEEKLYCDEDKEDISNLLVDIQKELKKNQMIIMHFRLKTIGQGEKNTQPVETDDFILIHNGVFTGLGEYAISDTIQFAYNLEALYAAADIKKENEEAFLKAYLEQTAGYWSLFIYSKKTKKLYYFRDGAQFSKFADGLMYSTKPERFPTFSIDAPAFA